ncbi:MAG: class B sortase [Ruminiclostridium sp.]|nr:class B sortase [Ruminiclostridium sp.]
MKHKTLIKCLLVFLILVFLASGGLLLQKQLDYRNGQQNYDEASTLAHVDLPPAEETTEPLSPYEEALSQIDLAALQTVNPDVAGWIMIPETDISYPLLQADDNSYYLNRTWDGTRNSVGAIFLDYRNNRPLTDFNSVIYGHKMNNQSMFGLLHQYKNDGFWQAHPILYLVDEKGPRQYDVFAYYETGSMNTYSLEFQDQAARQAYIDECLAQAWLDTGIIPEPDEHILTLSTCTGRGHTTRWVVQAVYSPDP